MQRIAYERNVITEWKAVLHSPGERERNKSRWVEEKRQKKGEKKKKVTLSADFTFTTLFISGHPPSRVKMRFNSPS